MNIVIAMPFYFTVCYQHNVPKEPLDSKEAIQLVLDAWRSATTIRGVQCAMTPGTAQTPE